MPIDARIPLGFESPQINTAAQTLGQVYALRGAQQEQQLRQVQMQKAQQQMDEDAHAKQVRQQVGQGIGSVGDSEADQKAFIKSLTDPDARLAAIEAFGKIGENRRTAAQAKEIAAKANKDADEAERRHVAFIAQKVADSNFDPRVSEQAYKEMVKDYPERAQEMAELIHGDPMRYRLAVSSLIKAGPDYTAPTRPADYTINDTRYSGVTNQPLVTAPVPVPQPGDYTLGRQRFSGKTNQPIATGAPTDTGAGNQVSYQRADVEDSTGHVIPANFNPKTGEYFDARTGVKLTDFGSKPTAEVINRRENVRGLVPMIKSMKALSDGIITRVGPAQRANAVKRGMEAIAGEDAEFASYLDFRKSLAVMVAVSAQGARPSDADVYQAALPLVPNPYSDTKESAERKWNLITTMFKTRLSKDALSELGLDKVSMVDPDGNDLEVPEDQVKDAEAKGAKRKK